MARPATFDKIALIATIVALSRRDRWSRAALLRNRERQLGRLRRFAQAHSAFYGRFHKGLEDAPLERLPVLTKDMLMGEFDRAVTVPGITLDRVQRFAQTMSVTDLLDDRYHVVATSGTTGTRGFFLFTRAEWRVLAMASVARGIGWTGANPRGGGRGVVMASTIPWHMTARASAELRRLGLDAGRMSLDAGTPVDTLVEDLNRAAPTMMMVYPSVLQILAAEQRAGRLHIAPGHIQCTSEVLTTEAREAIEQAFGVVPSNLYAASECGCIAASCAQNRGLHLSEDLLIVENVDERGRAVPDGVLGAKTLVTVLSNRTLPLIRYEMSDQVSFDTAPCACGKPYARIAEIGGRQGDVLRLPGLTGADVAIAPAQITAALRGTAIVQWQATLSPGTLTLACVCPAESFDPAEVVGRIGALLHERGAHMADIRAERIERVKRGVTGKSQVTTVTR